MSSPAENTENKEVNENVEIKPASPKVEVPVSSSDYVVVQDGEGSEPMELPVTKDDNSLGLNTLTSAFPGSHGLKYKNPKTGAYRALMMDSSGTKFLPPSGGWEDKTFTVIFPASRVPSPMMIDLPSSPNEELTIERMKDYVYSVDGIVACATAITDNVLASCYHCVKHFVTPNADEIQSHRDAVIHLTHAVKGQQIHVKIRAYSIERDIVLLHSDVNLMVTDGLQFRHAYFGQPYYLLGTPTSDDGNPLQVLSGRISAKLEGNLMSVGHSLHGHGSARPGASGGPVFGCQLLDGKPSLLGIVAAGQNITNQTILLTFISSNYVKIISTGTLHDAYLLSQEGHFKFN